MFRCAENIPEIYVNKSRDFQLLCRLKDLSFNAVKYSIDSLRHTSNTLEMNSSLLPLLKSKVGFFSDENLTEDQLRYLLSAFPAIIKKKGTEQAIRAAVNTWFRVYHLEGKLNTVRIQNADSVSPYEIILYLNADAYDTSLLDELFRYILPTGYLVTYEFVKLDKQESTYALTSDVRGTLTYNKYASNTNVSNDPALYGSVHLTEIATQSDAHQYPSTATDSSIVELETIDGKIIQKAEETLDEI